MLSQSIEWKVVTNLSCEVVRETLVRVKSPVNSPPRGDRRALTDLCSGLGDSDQEVVWPYSPTVSRTRLSMIGVSIGFGRSGGFQGYAYVGGALNIQICFGLRLLMSKGKSMVFTS